MRRTIRGAALAGACTVGLSLGAVGGARAQVTRPPPPPPFAAAGQTILTTEAALDYQRDVASLDGEDDVTTTTYDFHLGFDRVMGSRLTLGGRLGFAGVDQGLVSRKGFDLGGRFGGLVPLGSSTMWWPTIGFRYGLTSYADKDSTASVRTLTLVIAAPFVWYPARHLLLGIGPTYAHDLQAKTGPDDEQQAFKVRGFGVHGLLGVWF